MANKLNSFKDGFIIQYNKNYSLNKLINIKNPIIIQGLPGIGNIGKLSVDFIIKDLKANLIFTVYSSYFPSTVIVNENNLVKFLSIKFYYKSIKKNNFIFVSGETQPLNEYNSYICAEKIVDILRVTKPKMILAIGGIGLNKPVLNPRMFITSSNKKYIKKFIDLNKSNKLKKTKNKLNQSNISSKTSENLNEKNNLLHLNTKLYGFVGPIIGLTGLVPSIAGLHNIPNIIILTETIGNPFYLGVNESKNIITFLSNKFDLNVNLKKYEKEFINNFTKNSKPNNNQKLQDDNQNNVKNYPASYIG